MNDPVHALWAPAHRANPRPLYARLRQQAPLVRVEDRGQGYSFWLATRYKDVVELMRDPQLTKSGSRLSAEARQRFFPLNNEALMQHMLNVEPADHTRLRTLVSQAFTPSRVEALRPRIHALASELLSAALAKGRVDFMDAFAFPLPLTVITELLGVPTEDRGPFRAWTTDLLTSPKDGNREAMVAAGASFLRYFHSLLERRRREPGEDLVSALLAAEEQGDRLNEQELLAMLFLLLVAGHETTVNLLGGGLLALLQHPEQLQRLREDPGLLPSAVEELLRYTSPVETTTSRFTVEETELFGQRLPAEEMVIAGLMSANHDPELFPEPERFDVGRTPNRHVAFGFGAHHCLGAPLARLEATVALELLLERVPRMRLATAPDKLTWRHSLFVRGLEQLPVELG
jgi:cytochrome P450